MLSDLLNGAEWLELVSWGVGKGGGSECLWQVMRKCFAV